MKYPLKSMTVGEILDTAFKVFRNNFVTLFLIGVLVQVLGVVFLKAFTLLLIPLVASGGSESLLAASMDALVVVILAIFIAPFGTAISTNIIANRYLGVPVTIVDALSAAVKVLLPLIGAIFLAGLLTGIGVLLLILPGIYLSLRFALVAPSCIVEGNGGTTALRRSGELVKGSYGKIFGIFVIAYVIAMIIGGTAGFLLGGVSLVGQLVTYFIHAVLGAYFGAVWTITYFERRCALEGFDLQILAESIGAEVPELEAGSGDDEEWK